MSDLQLAAGEVRSLEKIVKCPFCGEHLKFQKYEKRFGDSRITLRCGTCNLDFELSKPELGFLDLLLRKKPKWEIVKIEKAWR